MEGFKEFVKKQGVVGIAVGLTIGLAAVEMIQRVLAALVTPIIELIAGEGNISDAFAVTVGETTLKFGEAIDAIIQFLVLAFAVYVIVKAIGADKWDAKD